MPNNSNWIMLYGVGVLTGIGFTMSLFVGNLAFVDTLNYSSGVKIGVLLGSLLSTLFGYFLILLCRKKIIDNKILDLAHDLTNYGLKNKYKYIATLKNKNCGDVIKVEINLKDKLIKQMYYETESCILCQASASLVSKNIKNISINDIDNLINSKKFEILNLKKYFKKKKLYHASSRSIEKSYFNLNI